MISYMGFINAGLLRAFSVVNVQMKVLQVAFLKTINPGILYFPKLLEELVFHKNALGNTEATKAHISKDVDIPQPAGIFLLCPLQVSHVKCKDIYSDFFHILRPYNVQMVS